MHGWDYFTKDARSRPEIYQCLICREIGKVEASTEMEGNAVNQELASDSLLHSSRSVHCGLNPVCQVKAILHDLPKQGEHIVDVFLDDIVPVA